MAWIRTIEEGEADAVLRAMYRAHVDPLTGALDEIVRVHSLHPAGLAAHMQLYGAVMRGTQGLRKAEREMIALVVSVSNECHY